MFLCPASLAIRRRACRQSVEFSCVWDTTADTDGFLNTPPLDSASSWLGAGPGGCGQEPALWRGTVRPGLREVCGTQALTPCSLVSFPRGGGASLSLPATAGEEGKARGGVAPAVYMGKEAL